MHKLSEMRRSAALPLGLEWGAGMLRRALPEHEPLPPTYYHDLLNLVRVRAPRV